jgi:hypothetical protein
VEEIIKVGWIRYGSSGGKIRRSDRMGLIRKQMFKEYDISGKENLFGMDVK